MEDLRFDSLLDMGFFTSPKPPDRLRGLSTLLGNGYLTIFLRDKAARA
jgi:hypothetical protein